MVLGNSININFVNNSNARKNKNIHNSCRNIKALAIVLSFCFFVLLSKISCATTYFNNQYRWDIAESYLDVIDGTSDAYDSCYFLDVYCSNTGTWTTFNSNHYTINNSLSSYGYIKNWQIMCNNQINVTRFFFVNKSSSERWGRYIDCIENIGSNPITVRIRWRGNLGSDGSTREWQRFYANGELLGVGTDDYDNGGDPSLAHIYGFNFSWSRSTDNIYMSSNYYTLSPGQKVCFVLYVFQGPNQNTVRSDVNQLLNDINTSNINAKWFAYIDEYREFIFNFPQIAIPPANISMQIVTNKERYFPDENISVNVTINITNVTQNITIQVQTYLYDILFDRILQQFNETFNITTNTTIYLNYTFIAPPRTDYYYICSKVTNGRQIERCIRIEVTAPVELINEVRNLINNLQQSVNYLREDVTNISFVVQNIQNITQLTYDLLQELNQTSTEKLNQILDNITIIKAKINALSSDLQDINQTLYNKLIDLENNLTQFETELKDLIVEVENNLTDEINKTKQELLSYLTQINSTVIDTNNLVYEINNTLTEVYNKLNELYDLTLNINGTTEQILNKTITILQQLYDIQIQLTNNFTVVNEKLDWLIAKLKNITMKVKPVVIIKCTKDNYVGKPVKCNVTVTVLGKRLNLPLEIYVQKIEETQSLSGEIKTKTINVLQFDKVFAINGSATFTFTPSSPGKYKIIVTVIPGYYNEEYYIDENYNETELDVQVSPWFDISPQTYNIIVFVIIALCIIGLISLGLKTIFRIITQKLLDEKFEFLRKRK